VYAKVPSVSCKHMSLQFEGVCCTLSKSVPGCCMRVRDAGITAFALCRSPRALVLKLINSIISFGIDCTGSRAALPRSSGFRQRPSAFLIVPSSGISFRTGSVFILSLRRSIPLLFRSFSSCRKPHLQKRLRVFLFARAPLATAAPRASLLPGVRLPCAIMDQPRLYAVPLDLRSTPVTEGNVKPVRVLDPPR